MILVAAHGAKTQQALSHLCETYWEPLYGFLRNSGHNEEDAADLVQGFFGYILESNGLNLKHVDRQTGRFRSYLLGALKHYVGRERSRNHAIKRGGGRTLISLTTITEEQGGISHPEPRDERTPERAFAQRWVVTLIERSYERLRREWQKAGKGQVFEALKSCLYGDERPAYRDLARHMETTEGALRVALYRLRRRLAQLVRSEVAATVTHREDVESEIRDLLTMLKR